MVALIHSFQSEWLKRKRSLASWLVLVGAFFTPFIFTLANILKPEKVPAKFAAPGYWETSFHGAWQSMNILLMPMGIILAITLLTQLEYKNNTWKQWHATPQSYTTIFITKFFVLLVMEAQLFLLFNIGIYLTALIPSIVLDAVPYPPASFPWLYFARESALYFVDHLPIVAIQFLLALQFRNFLVPLGAGVVLLVAGLLAASWEYAYMYPYNYAALYWMKRFPEVNLHAWALGWFTLVIIASYVLYLTKRDKS